MHEGNDRREGVVVIDNVGQIGHCFATFVHRGGECLIWQGRRGLVDSINCILPSRYWTKEGLQNRA